MKPSHFHEGVDVRLVKGFLLPFQSHVSISENETMNYFLHLHTRRGETFARHGFVEA